MVLCVNLFMIFITDNEIDMVLNSLALEFILHVDEELKAFLFEILKEEEEEEDFCLLFYQLKANREEEEKYDKHWNNRRIDSIINHFIIVILVLSGVCVRVCARDCVCVCRYSLSPRDDRHLKCMLCES